MGLTRVAAVQLEAQVGNIDANLEMCAELGRQAVVDGAQWVILPEFFSTGVANRPDLAQNAPAPDGAPTQMLCDLARNNEVFVGGSTLVRDTDGNVRNAFFVVGPDGQILGRHDKDLPTMWESSLYIGGSDSGVVETGQGKVGVAMCWELLRRQSAARLAGQVDLIVSGSGWWSIPSWAPRPLTQWLELRNSKRAVAAPTVFAEYCGAPIVHGAHAGFLQCPMPLLGATYSGHFEGGASVSDGHGNVLAQRRWDEGSGLAIADVKLERSPSKPLPERFWLQKRGTLPAIAWVYQNAWGRAEYQRIRGHQPLSNAARRYGDVEG